MKHTPKKRREIPRIRQVYKCWAIRKRDSFPLDHDLGVPFFAGDRDDFSTEPGEFVVPVVVEVREVSR